MGWVLDARHSCEPGVNDNIRPGAVDYCFEFGLLFGGNCELIQRELKIVQECLPLRTGNLQMLMRVSHRLAGVLLRSTRSPAHHLGHQILEACRRYAMMR